VVPQDGTTEPCTASGSWSGLKALSGTVSIDTTGLTVGQTYSYALMCVGTNGNASGVATLTIGNPVNVAQNNCSLALPNSSALVSPAYTATAVGSGALCTTGGTLACSVANTPAITSGSVGAYATVNLNLDLLDLGTETITVAPSPGVTPQPNPIPAGTTTGFVVAIPNELVTADVLADFTVTAQLSNGGTYGLPSPTNSTTLALGLLDLINYPSANAVFISLPPLPSSATSLSLGISSAVSVLGAVNVYSACTIPQ